MHQSAECIITTVFTIDVHYITTIIKKQIVERKYLFHTQKQLASNGKLWYYLNKKGTTQFCVLPP